MINRLFLLLIISTTLISAQENIPNDREIVSTFSIVARDAETGELGVAVASRFFAVGSVVPWADANIGAVATQSFMNTSFGWRGLDLLDMGASPAEIVEILVRDDDDPTRRQFGIVSATGESATYTGENCIPWAGGRAGENYACQGNILTGEDVIIAVEETFLKTQGTLAERIYAALCAGDAKGGDTRGKQSAGLLIVKEGAGYGGYTDRAIDIRVDDHKEPFKELGRLLDFAQMNYLWNEAWTLHMQKEPVKALPLMEKAALVAPDNPDVLYDLVVIQCNAGKIDESLNTLEKVVTLNPNLKKQACGDSDLLSLRTNKKFIELTDCN
ncbi:DUF1028 domain-containing protein [Bacteroidota bacterium]